MILTLPAWHAHETHQANISWQCHSSLRRQFVCRAQHDPYITCAHCSNGEIEIDNRPRKEGPSWECDAAKPRPWNTPGKHFTTVSFFNAKAICLSCFACARRCVLTSTQRSNCNRRNFLTRKKVRTLAVSNFRTQSISVRGRCHIHLYTCMVFVCCKVSYVQPKVQNIRK